MTSQEQHVLGQHDENDNGTPRGVESHEAIQLREEELAARKQSVEAGRLSLGTEVVETQATLDVPVKREEVTVERHPVDRRPTDEPITTNAETITVPLREEQVSVDKQSVVYEESQRRQAARPGHTARHGDRPQGSHGRGHDRQRQSQGRCRGPPVTTATNNPRLFGCTSTISLQEETQCDSFN